MLSPKRNLVSGVSLALALVAVLILGIATMGCNEHRFTPVASIKVQPDVIELDLQKPASYVEEVLLTNDSTSARLEIFEINFEDSTGGLLNKTQKTVLDQSITMAQLAQKQGDGTAIQYTYFSMGITSDVTCEVDSDCHCDPEEAECDSNANRMGEMFTCVHDPLELDNPQSTCTAYYKYFNRADASGVSEWGGATEYNCGTVEDCARFGPDFVCLDEGSVCSTNAETGSEVCNTTKVCGTDIKVDLSVEYGFERLVAVDSSEVKTDRAAVWQGINGEALCLFDEDTNTKTPVDGLYGLNRCDQIALKLKMNNIEDDNNGSGVMLHSRSQANYRLMVSHIDQGQNQYVAFCDSNKLVNQYTVMLMDPIPATESCYQDGAFRSDLLSIDPDLVKMDQLPMRVLYAPHKASDYPVGQVLTAKEYTMNILSSAEEGGTAAREVTITVPENKGGPPIPVIEIPADYANPEPLDDIHLDGSKSYSPFGESRQPFTYKWEWAPGGKPAFAQDAVLVDGTTGSFDNPVSIMGEWTDESSPKIKFPIAGEYCFRLYVKDAAGVESGPDADCPDCPEYDEKCVLVKPSQKLHVELIWDRGDNVDLDLFLVRYRDDGTFGVPAAFQDKIEPTAPTMGACTTDDDCPGHFTCGGTYCENSCDTDEQCKAINGGWFCNDYNQCAVSLEKVIECESDDDCNGGYCNPSKVGATGYRMICTRRDSLSVNDTCFFLNGTPRWGEYSAPDVSCNGDAECNGPNADVFTCDTANSSCDFTCDSSSQCLTKSSQYLCGEGGSCVANSQEDDPSLDIDDVDGWGPENISLKEPVSGTYRIVARLYADPDNAVGDESPNAPVKAFVQIYLNGELALKKGIAQEFSYTNTYWKVADIEWDATEDEGTVAPICAGWTQTKCENTEECQGWYANEYTCEARDWGKFCSSCVTGTGTPDECNPTTPCSTDSDCVDEPTSKTCATIVGNFCKCNGSNPYSSVEQNPYANPFITTLGGVFDPNDSYTQRSIWCDSAQEMYNATDSCSTLYSR